MALTYVTGDDNTNYGSGVEITLSVNVQIGDLICVSAGSIDGLTVESIEDDDGNSYTLRDGLSSSGARQRTGYCLSATATSSPLTITVTFASGTGRHNAACIVFRPDGGETVTFDVGATKESGWEGSPWETDSDSSTTGTDEACFASFQNSGGAASHTNCEIPSGTAATETIDGNNRVVFYRILSATVSNIEAETDPSGSGFYCAELLCFKSESAGGESVTITTVSLSYTGQSVIPEEAIIPVKGAIDLEGQSVKANEAITPVMVAMDITGKNVIPEEAIIPEPATLNFAGQRVETAETITLTTGTLDWIGQNVVLGGVVIVTLKAIGWAGQKVKASETIISALKAIDWVGQSITPIVSETVNIGKLTLSYVGNAIKANEAITVALKAIDWAGRSISVAGGAIKRGLSKLGQSLRLD